MTSRRPLRPVVLGVILFVASEAVFFGLLIITYVYFSRDAAVSSQARTHLDPIRTAIFSLFLLSSSFTMWSAERVRRAAQPPREQLLARGGPGVDGRPGNAPGARLWLTATLALGAVFLIGQAIEYAGLFAAGMGLGTNLFASTFFTLTGFHGLHVLIGLIAIAIVLALDAGSGAGQGAAQQSVAVYWHFVDAVWLVIFVTVYVLTFGATP